jgi:hypothetical protein
MFAVTNWSEVFKWILLMPLFAIMGATASLLFVYTVGAIFYLLEKIYIYIINPLFKKYPIIHFISKIILVIFIQIFIWLILLTIISLFVEEFTYQPFSQYNDYEWLAIFNLILTFIIFVFYNIYNIYNKYQNYKEGIYER